MSRFNQDGSVRTSGEFKPNTDQSKLGTPVSLEDETRDSRDTNSNWNWKYDADTEEYVIRVKPSFLHVSSSKKSAIVASGSVSVPFMTPTAGIVGHTLSVTMYRKATDAEVIQAELSGKFAEKDANKPDKVAEARTFLLACNDAGMPGPRAIALATDRFGEKVLQKIANEIQKVAERGV